MLDFLRKDFLWRALDAGYLNELATKVSYQLKTAQDLAIYEFLRAKKGLEIAEIGGGDSRVLGRLAKSNTCCNIEKFEGQNAGPNKEVVLQGVYNIKAFIGEFDDVVSDEAYDAVFSISVVEHVATSKLDDFHSDTLRILKSGGIFLHAIDMYVGDATSEHNSERLAAYRSMIDGDERTRPLGDIVAQEPVFECSMVSNPDNILHGWNLYAPQLSKQRQATQSVSLLLGGVKR